MKNKFSALAILFAILLVCSVIPIRTNALGGYFVIKGEKVYHFATCEKLKGMNIEDLRWYESLDELKWTGYAPCNTCTVDGYDYDRDGDTFLKSKNNEYQNWLEIERLFGVLDGYEVGNQSGYDAGYSEGNSVGYEEGHSDAKNMLEYKIDEVKSNLYMAIFLFAIGTLLISAVYFKRREQDKEKLNQDREKFENEKAIAKNNLEQERNNIASWKQKVLQEVSEEEQVSIAAVKEKQSELQKEIEFFQQTIKKAKQSHPELATEIADAQYHLDMGIFDQLVRKPRPALRAADELKQIATEKRLLLKENRQLQYQLNFYEKLFPWLEEFKEVPSDEAVSYATGSYGSEYDAIKRWISPEEYEKLNTADKYQLALDRWKTRKKSDWDIGIEYERFIGYKLECDGYKVSYIGATLGLKDMGRDLLATKSGETLIIQCKRWSKEKTIHEKHIFQLYGSSAVYAIEHPDSHSKAVFITTTELSDTARKCAEYCGIAVVENCPMGEYPLIKCNANKGGEKIYHLPFDQQYDKIVVSKNKQSCYAWTTHEAEGLGFRRAYRWRPNKS